MELKIKKYPKRSPHWIIRGTVAGQRVFESSGTTDKDRAKKLAKQKEAEIYDAIKFGEHPPVTFSQAADAYLDGGGDERFLTPMVAHFKDTLLRNIGQTEIDNAAIALYSGAKASTINRNLISRFITVARKAVKNKMPGAVLNPIERRKIEKVVATPANDEHLQKLLPHCPVGLQALILLMTYTGLRTGEALCVKEKDIKDGYIHVEKTKNGDARMVPVPVDWAWPAGGFGYGTSQGVGRALRAASERAGIEYRDGHEIGRHAFAARWLKAGHSLKDLKEAGGWKTLKVVDEVYGHLEQTRLHETMRELSKRKK